MANQARARPDRARSGPASTARSVRDARSAEVASIFAFLHHQASRQQLNTHASRQRRGHQKLAANTHVYPLAAVSPNTASASTHPDRFRGPSSFGRSIGHRLRMLAHIYYDQHFTRNRLAAPPRPGASKLANFIKERAILDDWTSSKSERFGGS